MSTRSTTHFIEGDPEHPTAIIYRHTDGDLDWHGRDLQKFFAAVESQTGDTRFDDPSYLAPKLVVYLAAGFARDPGAPLAFLGVGVVDRDPGDIAYRYVVDCANHDERGRPTVKGYTHDGEEVEIPAEEVEV